MKTVYTSGTWDLFHVGHLNIFKRSKKLGDFLIVAVSTDELVESYKEIKPAIPYRQRVEIVKSIKYVDKVVKQTVLTDIRHLKKYNVDIVTIGSDWKKRHLDGLEWMKKHGQVVYLDYTEGISATTIKEEIIRSSYEIISSNIKREMQSYAKFKKINK